MSQETELLQLHEELSKIKNSVRKTARRSIIGMVILIIVTATSLLYSFVKNVEATRNAEEANAQRILAEQLKAQAEMNAGEAIKQEMIANELSHQLNECRQGKR